MAVTLPTGWRWRNDEPATGSLLARVGAARGLSAEALKTFLTPDFYANWHDPKLLPDCEAAVDRLVVALEKQQSILIFGDYDADGIPATAVVLRALRELGASKLAAIIPTRDQGYGLSATAVTEIIARQPALVITVDTGSSSTAEVAALRAAGIDVIITDHHELPAEAPEAITVNPKRSDSQYPNRDLAGCAVAYKLMWALYEKLSVDLTPLKYLLDLVALSTMADLMPLTAENRSLVIFGLKVMQRTKILGLRALLLAGDIAPTQVDYRHLSFFLAPRLNAISRLGLDRQEQDKTWGSLALALLMADDPAEADKLARRLHEINESRRTTVADWQSALDKLPVVPDEPVVAYLPDAPVGVLGLIAGALVEKRGVPALIMGLDVDGVVRGSGRSLVGYPPLPEMLASLDGLLLRFGGHNEAAGWSLEPDKLAEFTSAVKERLRPLGEAETISVTVDAELLPEEATVASAESLTSLAPYGSANTEPVLFVTGILKTCRGLGSSGAHVKLVVAGYESLSIVWFNHGQTRLPQEGETVYLAGRLAVNVWREPEPQLVIEAAQW